MSSGSSRSSSDDVDAALDEVAGRVLDALADGTAPVVLIDGRSGAGKTSLARLLAERWGGDVEVVALDELYPGWDGLDAGVAEARARVLEPRSRGEAARYRRWDWEAARWVDGRTVARDVPLVVEGSGVVTPDTARLADLTVWLDSPAVSRRSRALARDGELYRPHWERWALQEDEHVRRDRPEALADIVGETP